MFLQMFNDGSQKVHSPESENLRNITYEFISEKCKTNPILSAVGGLQMNVSIYLKMTYENKCNWTLGENKPNFRKAQMNVNSLITKDYRKKGDFAVQQNKPNSNPIQTQTKPILEAMNVNFCAAGYYESKPTFAVRKGRPNNPNDARLSGRSSWRAHSFHDKSKVRDYNPEGV